MRRRAFLVLLGAAAASSLPALAQPRPMPVIGFLNVTSADAYKTYVEAFREGLKDAGYVEGENVTIEFRWAEGHYDRLPALAAELVHLPATLILASGGGAPAMAVRAANPTIPMVFTTGGDPVKLGLVGSLNHPGGNTTGVNLSTNALIAKRVELLRELLPTAETIALLSDPTSPAAAADTEEAKGAARAQGFRLVEVTAGTKTEFEAAFATFAQKHAEGLVVGASAVFTSERSHLVALAARYAIPAIFEWPDFATAGGLMSYGTNLADGYRQAGIYAGRILKGEKPGDLPVMQLSKVDLVVNLRTARALGLTIPQSLLARADEVIE
ncbi:MAG TPA: ABC transporter substrate-binding protein [Stellaceae bacterium]|nr:ABC transporter substrate-binding protein [Stellaceae bacterium]